MELTPDWPSIRHLFIRILNLAFNFASSHSSYIFDQSYSCIERTEMGKRIRHTEVRKILHLAQIYLEAALPLPGYPFPRSSLVFRLSLFILFLSSPPSPSILAKQKAIGHASESRVSDTWFPPIPSSSSLSTYFAFSAGSRLKTKGWSFFSFH